MYKKYNNNHLRDKNERDIINNNYEETKLAGNYDEIAQ